MTNRLAIAFALAALALGAIALAVSAATGNLLSNASLESASNGVPTCWLLGGYGTNSYTWARTTDAHSGSYAEQLTVTKLSSGDRKLVSKQDSGTCAPAATPGHAYTVTVYYKSNTAPRLFAYYRTAKGSWDYWTSKGVPASNSWTQATWTTPAVPSGATNLSVGVGLTAVGSLTMDDFALVDRAGSGDQTPPTVAITNPANASTVSGNVDFNASASDNVAVSRVDFLVDGKTVASDASAPYTDKWDSASVSNGQHSLQARAVDSSGNTTTTGSDSVTVSNAIPPPPGTTYFGTLPSGAALPNSDALCASLVTPTSWEPRPDNYNANHTVPSGPVSWNTSPDWLYWTKWIADRNQVTGNFTGTTTMIFQWAACKWGIDENTLRAVAVQESDWHESAWGDRCSQTDPSKGIGSYGITQIKNRNCSGNLDHGGYPTTAQSTALNVDYYAAHIRACYDGDFYDGGSWLYGGQTVTQIAAVHGWSYVLWGCIGQWFSGHWYDSGANDYINKVQSKLAQKTWLSY
jgi:Big-like domain-containing protein